MAASVTVSVAPPEALLNPLGVQSFSATVSGSGNKGVKWSYTPQIGDLIFGGNTAVYVAPALIETAQTVTITATSLSNKTSYATVLLQLVPLVTISLTPGGATLPPSGTQQFVAAIQGTTNQGVTWSLQPNVGSISGSGLYQAPSSVSAPQTVTVTAQSTQDPTKTATAQVYLGTGVTFSMDSSGLTSLKWNNQEFLYAGASAPSFAQVYLGNPSVPGNNIMGKPSKTVTNPQQGTVAQTYPWGTATTQYKSAGNKLLITVTLKNTSSQTLTRYWMYPLGIQFPVKPVNTAYNMTFNMDAPSSVRWSYVTGTAALVNEDVTTPLALGFWQAENPAASKWLVSLFVDPTQSLNPNWPAVNRPISPGGSDTITVSLRFGRPGATEMEMSGDIYALFSSTYPRALTSTAARRPLARLSFTGSFRPTFPTNPRGWFNEANVDVTTPQGIAAFQRGLLGAADRAIAEMTRVGAGGGILWDIEGQQLDQSYIGDPSQAETLAPELVGVLDAFVGKFKSAGFPIGFTLRPQAFSVQKGTISVSGTSVTWVSGSQFSSAWVQQPAGGSITIGNNNYRIASVQSPTSLTLARSAGNATAIPYLYGLQTNTGDPFSVLNAKVQYAMKRWGATLFYVDSTLDYTGNLTPADVWRRLIQAFPNATFFPEWKSPRDYAYTYPFLDAMNGATSPDVTTMTLYPNAGGLIRVPDDSKIGAARNTLIKAVSSGNILLFDGWYRHPGNDVVSRIYALAP
ncbi:MAG TPA: hypothetical protein VKB79_13600 [Bryobacteraceae bacterium]|nr:hypothetical protein [Bryobacteraceae bacterium]